MFGLLSVSVSTVDLVALKFKENEHPPLATSPHPVGPSASSAKYSTGQKRNNALNNPADSYLRQKMGVGVEPHAPTAFLLQKK
jgi:hypothetical protein